MSIDEGGELAPEGSDAWRPADAGRRLSPPPPQESEAGWETWGGEDRAPWSSRPVPPTAPTLTGAPEGASGSPAEAAAAPPPSLQPGLVRPQEGGAPWQPAQGGQPEAPQPGPWPPQATGSWEAAQSASWSAGQARAWDTRQTGAWDDPQAQLWDARQTGTWDAPQGQPWDAPQAAPWDTQQTGLWDAAPQSSSPTGTWQPAPGGPQPGPWQTPVPSWGPPGGPPGGTWRSPIPPWQPPPRRQRTTRGALAAILVLVIIAGIIGAGIGAALAHKKTTTAAPPSFAPSGAFGNGNGNASPNASGIAAQVTPAVVDVNTTLGFQNAAAAGTGIVLTPTGEVLTNNHVVDGATKVTVQVAGSGPQYTAKVLGTDAPDDVALIQVDGVSNMKTANLGDSSKVAVGDPVVAIGNALGLPGPPSVTEGSVTALDQSITASDTGGANPENLTGLIQMDAPLQRGDSGGPLVNGTGQVIGMDTAAAGGSRSASSVAFAIPINSALMIVHQIEAGHATANIHIGPSALLGVQILTAPGGSGSGSGSGSASSTGAVVQDVTPNTPAQSAGIAAGDTITAVDGKTITQPSDLTQVLSGHHPGDSVKVTWVDTSGKIHSATVHLATGPAN